MHYTDLPAGRDRRIAYDIYLRNQDQFLTRREIIHEYQINRRISRNEANFFDFNENRNVASFNINRNNVIEENLNLDFIDFNIIEVEDLTTYRNDVIQEVENLNLEDVPTGLISKKLFDNSKIYMNFDPIFCCICQYHHKSNSICILRELKCTHKFHINCIDEWLIAKNKCPECRCEI